MLTPQTVSSTLYKMVHITIVIIFIKTIFGLHWPWERCDCCGKTWREIRREKKRTIDMFIDDNGNAEFKS